MRRQFSLRLSVVSRPLVGAVFFVALFGMAGGVHAQSSETDAERIARMRDLAGSSAPAALAEPAEGDTRADSRSASVTEEPNLPANEDLPRGGGGGSGGLGFFDRSSNASSDYSADGSGWVFNTLAALGVVIGLVFAIRWLLRRGGVVSAAVPRGSVVEVLSRTTVAPRSHVVLMRVGQRVLVVNDSQSGMRTLATVDDPEEVADLLGAIEASSPTSLSSGFQGTINRLTAQWSQDIPSAGNEPTVDETLDMDRTRGMLSGLRGRLATMSKIGGTS